MNRRTLHKYLLIRLNINGTSGKDKVSDDGHAYLLCRDDAYSQTTVTDDVIATIVSSSPEKAMKRFCAEERKSETATVIPAYGEFVHHVVFHRTAQPAPQLIQNLRIKFTDGTEAWFVGPAVVGKDFQPEIAEATFYAEYPCPPGLHFDVTRAEGPVC